MILPKLPRTTPAQSEVYWEEYDRLKSIKNRSIRLELIKRHNIRFEVDAAVICVYIGDNLVICVGNRKGAYRLVNNYLFTMYQTLWAMEGGYSHASPLHVAPDCPRPVTNRELSYWIAQGKGEMIFTDDGKVCDGLVAVHSYEYDLGETDSPVPSNILVRTWGRDGWVSPTRSYLGLK